jgi:mannosyltransferase OCH1-like enzyme
MIHYAAISGWEFRFITPSNLTDYLTEESQEKMKQITDKFEEHNIGVQQSVDIYRLFLLYDNGGMWVDASTLFVQDLGWIEHSF